MNEDLLKVIFRFRDEEMSKALKMIEHSVTEIETDELRILNLEGYIPTGIMNYIKAIRVDIRGK